MKGFPTIIYCKHKTAATKVGNSQYRFERAAPEATGVAVVAVSVVVVLPALVVVGASVVVGSAVASLDVSSHSHSSWNPVEVTLPSDVNVTVKSFPTC